MISSLAAAATATDEAAVPTQAGPAVAGTEDVANERIQALDGSRSAWSGQFQATYNGSTLDHPFSPDAPNPGHFTPPPVVMMIGSFSGRYRFDGQTTMGLGTGIGTETPLQGPKNTRASDPYVDLAHTWQIGPLHERIDLSAKVWTNHEYRDTYGYREGYSIYTDSYVEPTKALTLGLSLNAYRNTFASGDYNRAQQVQSQFFFDPFLEYRFNRTFNFRTIFASTETHSRAQASENSYYHPQDFQMLGLGIAATRDLYFYLYLKVFPYTSAPVTTHNSLIGFNTIINLF